MTGKLSRLALCATLAALLALPAERSAAQTAPSDPLSPPKADELGDAARQALEQALERVGPILQNMLSALEGAVPYDAPQVLPNGDILIPRRKPPPAPEPEADPPRTLDL